MLIPPRYTSICPLLLAIFLIFLCLPAAQAQLPKGDLFFGYSRTGSDVFYPNTGGLNGWHAAGSLKVAPFLSADADVAHYGLGADSAVPRTTTYLFGPRVTVGALGFKVFAHGLIGGEHSANNGGPVHISEGAFAYALGGGLDVPIAPFFGWRFLVDRIDAPSISPPGGTDIRFSTGLVFHF
ncbi:MAG: hypothetical protein WCA37_14970 [Terracidiphilus sp.]